MGQLSRGPGNARALASNSEEQSAIRCGRAWVQVRETIAEMNDPVKAVLGYLEHHRVDLIVLATRQRDGGVRWLGKSVSQPIARTAWQMTLFIPGGPQVLFLLRMDR